MPHMRLMGTGTQSSFHSFDTWEGKNGTKSAVLLHEPAHLELTQSAPGDGAGVVQFSSSGSHLWVRILALAFLNFREFLNLSELLSNGILKTT